MTFFFLNSHFKTPFNLYRLIKGININQNRVERKQLLALTNLFNESWRPYSIKWAQLWIA